MISIVQVYWKIKGFQGSNRISTKKGSDLITCLSDDISCEVEAFIDASGQGATTKVIDKKTKMVVQSFFESNYWTFDDVDDFEIVEEKERRCFASWEEAFTDKSYGKAMKELYDTKELGHDRHKYFAV